MICSYRNRQTERFHIEEVIRPAWRAFARQALRKLDMIEAARDLSDLAAVPGNRLERLRGDREGQHSVRINDQWRICFRWTAEGAADVEVVDYH